MRISMVFQKPNPFRNRSTRTSPTACGTRRAPQEPDRREGRTGLQGAALWDEVKDRLHELAFNLSAAD